MSCFAVFIRDAMHDREAFKTYTQKSGLARTGHEMKAHVYYGDMETLEGPPVDGVVIVEFPDKAAALAWYESPAYQDAKTHRLKAADYRVFLVDSL
jgi:uncharacterized protein (DUF1330 family)